MIPMEKGGFRELVNWAGSRDRSQGCVQAWGPGVWLGGVGTGEKNRK